MKQRRAIAGVVLIACLLSAGCQTVPMNYAEWKKAQEDRSRFAQAGIPYKSPTQLREEASEMRRAAKETTFGPGTK